MGEIGVAKRYVSNPYGNSRNIGTLSITYRRIHIIHFNEDSRGIQNAKIKIN